MSYDEQFVTALEWIWGEGFLSPGGPAEVAEVLGGADLQDKTVLDLGCGIGGVDFVLVERHGAQRVVGVDIEPQLVARARADAERRGLGERIEFRVVTPGPLPLDAGSVDVVFTKDSVIHVEDKPALFRDLFRVLRPAGLLLGSDWLGAGVPHSGAMLAWLELVKLQFALCSAAEIERALELAGFVEVLTRDRNAWYRDAVREEIEKASGENQRRLAAVLGEEAAAHRLRSSLAKQKVVDSGELRPTHFSARKPGRAAGP